MAPFKFSDDNIAKLMPFLSSVSYAMQASMGVYYQAIESVRIIAIRLVKSIFSDISTLSKNEDMSSVWTVLRGEDGVKYFDELVGLINEAEAVTLARLNASSVNLDKLRIHTSTDVVTFNADKKYVEDICRRYINKSSLRSSHGILFNVVERTLKREIADVTLFSTSDANELSDQIRNACIETIRDEYNPHVAVEKEMKSYQMAIDRLRDDMANMLKIRVEDHAIGRLLSMSFSLQSVLGYTKSASSATASMNNVLMYNLAKDILKLRKQRVFQINTNVSRMERTAYSLVKPSIFRLLAAFRYEWRHKIRSAYVPETIDFNFYDERHAVLRILETIGVDPNTTLSDNDAAFLSDVLGDGSIFTFKYVKGGTLYESIRLNSDEAQAASKSGLLVYSMLPIESIGDIFSDRVVLESSISHSHMLLINKLARDGEILDKLDSLDMMVNVTAIEADEVAAQFISADALAKRIFDNLVQPLISELWM
jgi:SHS2 domain-containing protein